MVVISAVIAVLLHHRSVEKGTDCCVVIID